MRLIYLTISNGHAHIQNKRNFPHSKPDSEINARFLLNEQDNLYVLLQNNSVHIKNKK